MRRQIKNYFPKKTPQLSKEAGAVLLLLVVVLVLPILKPRGNEQLTLKAYADQVLSRCEKESYRPSCYDQEIPKLMRDISMEEAFQVTSLVQQKDPSYTYCHVLGHELSANEVAKNPDGWKDVVSRCPSGVCSNGCIHGGFQERFRAESFTEEQIKAVKPDLNIICEKRDNWRPTGLEQASCYHALGHLTMYLTSADTNRSIQICDEIALKVDGNRDYRQLCYDGVFMQIYQPLEPEDFALVKGKQPLKEQVAKFCSNYTGAIQDSCLTESWPLFRSDLENPANLDNFCNKLRPEGRDRCYEVEIYVLTAQFNFNVEKIGSYCQGLTEDRQGACFANAASRLIETDYRNINQSVKLCQNATEIGKGQRCYSELLKYSRYNFHPDSESFYKLCNSLPEPWKSSCLAKENNDNN